MSAPVTGADADTFASPQKVSQTRVWLDPDYPALTAAKEDSFNDNSLDLQKWEASYLQAGPTESNDFDAGGEVKIYAHGLASPWMPSFEWIRTRSSYGWFPADYYWPFEMEFTFSYPQESNQFGPPIIVAGLENQYGDASDPLRIMQICGAQVSVYDALPGDLGKIFYVANGELPAAVDVANNLATHTVKIRFDRLHLVSTHSLEVLLDDVSIFTEDTGTPRPMSFQFGWVWNPVQDADGSTVLADDPATHLTLANLHYFGVHELMGYGYETRVDPEFIGSQDGDETNRDNIADGDYYVDSRNGHRYMKIPQRYLSEVSGERGISTTADTAKIVLNMRPFDSDVNDIFTWPWLSRTIMIDTREVAVTGVSIWRRQIAAYIKQADYEMAEDNLQITLTLRSIIEDLLDIYVERGFRGDDTSNITIEYDTQMNVSTVLETMCIVAEQFSGGGPLATIYRAIRDCLITVNDVGTLGQSQFSLFTELIDKIGYVYLIHYDIENNTLTDFGELLVHGATLGNPSAAPDYIIGPIINLKITEGVDAGPAQLIINQNDNNLPNALADQAGADHFPGSGLFPTVHYPNNGKPATDSIAYTNSLQAATGPDQGHTGLDANLILFDRNGDAITAGVAAHRFRLLSSNRRRASIQTKGLDHIEPEDIFSINTGPYIGMLHTFIKDDPDYESWIVDKISWSVKDGVFESTLDCRTVWWEEAIRRAL